MVRAKHATLIEGNSLQFGTKATTKLLDFNQLWKRYQIAFARRCIQVLSISQNSDYRANYFGIGCRLCNLHSLAAGSRATVDQASRDAAIARGADEAGQTPERYLCLGRHRLISRLSTLADRMICFRCELAEALPSLPKRWSRKPAATHARPARTAICPEGYGFSNHVKSPVAMAFRQRANSMRGDRVKAKLDEKMRQQPAAQRQGTQALKRRSNKPLVIFKP
jgi:hypothetical protein